MTPRAHRDRVSAARRSLSALAALAVGVAAGMACGGATGARETLPRAGGDDDDGTGFVARLSRGQHPRERGAGMPGGGQDGYGATAEGYGGGWYGGGVYGGGSYGVGGVVYPPYTPPPAPTVSGYQVTDVVESGKGGAIDGVVTWKGARAPASLPGVAGATRCAGALENGSLRVSASDGLRGAVVYLADVRAGKPAPLSLGGTLELGQCRFAPAVQLAAPIGTVMTVTNRDESPATVRLTRRGTGAAAGAAGADVEVVLSARGQGDVLLDRDGLLEASQPGGHPAASAWVVVPPHPYYVVTDEQGRFRIDDVPAGEYTLVVWHPPVVMGVDAAGVVQRSVPAESRTKLKVEERKIASARVELR